MIAVAFFIGIFFGLGSTEMASLRFSRMDMQMSIANQKVKEYMSRLASEHQEERDKAVAWFEAHPAESLPEIRRLARAGHLGQPTLWAACLLGRIGDDSDMRILEPLLAHSSSSIIWAAAEALAHHPSQVAEAVLLGALASKHPETVGAAAISLGMRGSESTRKPLEQLLRHADESVRYRAVLSLDRLGVGPSIAVLRAHLPNEDSSEVRRLIEEILNKRADSSNVG